MKLFMKKRKPFVRPDVEVSAFTRSNNRTYNGKCRKFIRPLVEPPKFVPYDTENPMPSRRWFFNLDPALAAVVEPLATELVNGGTMESPRKLCRELFMCTIGLVKDLDPSGAPLQQAMRDDREGTMAWASYMIRRRNMRGENLTRLTELTERIEGLVESPQSIAAMCERVRDKAALAKLRSRKRGKKG